MVNLSCGLLLIFSSAGCNDPVKINGWIESKEDLVAFVKRSDDYIIAVGFHRIYVISGQYCVFSKEKPIKIHGGICVNPATGELHRFYIYELIKNHSNYNKDLLDDDILKAAAIQKTILEDKEKIKLPDLGST